MSSNEVKLILSGLDCANCANKIETKVNNLDGINEATLNFATSTLIIELNGTIEREDAIKEIKSIVNKLEPGVKVFDKDENRALTKKMLRSVQVSLVVNRKMILIKKVITIMKNIHTVIHMNTPMDIHMIILMGMQ
ncbi:hypothetical protein SDC9_45577 [bioreactor metagenome]|uniref:HMA domain-containing protein n=1 Tax=bioreactor metagenome TaxID=1076179 RepID=A0A644W7A1_9ZZZZ